ncbi:MAG: SAM-dependent methyltransferase [Rhodobacter sp.]|nr:SAM-dependent methyltransferase [Rhodobacter sp.]
MTPLAELLIRRIAATGPISVAEFMADCLMHPAHGYYSTRDPLGAAGDFTTAPEISQMFGELIGLALAQTWADQGAPAPVTLAELGPGRGTLMADALRAAAKFPGFADAAQVHLVEASPALRARQRATLPGHAVTWHDHAGTLPEAPLLLIANEFFDALPIRQFQRDPSGWRERQVGLTDGALAFGLSAPAPLAELAPRRADTTPGDIVETCAPARPVMGAIANRIAAHGGAALIVDYGDWRSRGDTLQAVRGHAPEDPLAHPGAADLTAHVDFEALAQAAPGLAHSRLTPQGVFLERLGITARAQALAGALSGDALTAHIAAHRRLTHPAEMGSLFKVLALYPPGLSPPPGLEP